MGRFLRENWLWILVPIVLVIALAVLVIVLGQSGDSPFVYEIGI